MPESSLVPMERFERAILLLRGHRVMVDADLAALYGVSIKRLNEQVRRNIKRFPPDFMFQLTAEEAKALRSQFATLKGGRGGRSGSASAKQDRYSLLALEGQGRLRR